MPIGVKLSSNACHTGVLPPLILPFIGGKQEICSLPLERGGLGWGDADHDGKPEN